MLHKQLKKLNAPVFSESSPAQQSYSTAPGGGFCSEGFPFSSNFIQSGNHPAPIPETQEGTTPFSKDRFNLEIWCHCAGQGM